jgi:hypothetical protein
MIYSKVLFFIFYIDGSVWAADKTAPTNGLELPQQMIAAVVCVCIVFQKQFCIRMLWKDESGFRGKRKRHTSCLQHACFGPPLMLWMATLIHLPLAWGVGYNIHEMTRGVIPKALTYLSWSLIVVKQESNLSDSTARNGMLPSATYIHTIFDPLRCMGG